MPRKYYTLHAVEDAGKGALKLLMTKEGQNCSMVLRAEDVDSADIIDGEPNVLTVTSKGVSMHIRCRSDNEAAYLKTVATMAREADDGTIVVKEGSGFTDIPVLVRRRGRNSYQGILNLKDDVVFTSICKSMPEALRELATAIEQHAVREWLE